MVTTDGRKAGLEAAPLPQSVAVALEAALQFGGVFFGVAVASMKVVLADGRELKFDLPAPAGGRPLAGDADIAAKVLAVLKDGSWVTGRALAEAVGLTYGGGQFIATMGQLRREGEVVSSKSHGYKISAD